MVIIMMMPGREGEGKMRFYDFKRRLGDKGSEVMMVMVLIMMMVMMIMIMMIMFLIEYDYASVCKVKCRRKTGLTKDDSTSSIWLRSCVLLQKYFCSICSVDIKRKYCWTSILTSWTVKILLAQYVHMYNLHLYQHSTPHVLTLLTSSFAAFLLSKAFLWPSMCALSDFFQLCVLHLYLYLSLSVFVFFCIVCVLSSIWVHFKFIDPPSPLPGSIFIFHLIFHLKFIERPFPLWFPISPKQCKVDQSRDWPTRYFTEKKRELNPVGLCPDHQFIGCQCLRTIWTQRGHSNTAFNAPPVCISWGASHSVVLYLYLQCVCICVLCLCLCLCLYLYLYMYFKCKS